MTPDLPTESSIPTSQALPAINPPATGSSPGAPAPMASGRGATERIDARIICNICVEEDLAREREIKEALYREINTLRAEIRSLKTRADQSETVIADIQTLRRDVNSLLERSAAQLLAEEQDHLHPGAGPAYPITAEEASASRPVEHLPQHTAEEPDKSSFSKLSELLARLERLETSKRDAPDHRQTVRRKSREQHSRNNRHRGRGGSDSDSSTDRSPRRHRDGSSSDDSSSEDDNRHRKSRRSPHKGGNFRPKGERYRKLKPLVATDSRFRKVLNYRFYRLDRTSKSRDLGKLRHHVKSMMVTLRRHIFDGRDPILILDFLRRYSNECDAQGMSEPQAHCALEYFLDGPAADHFAAVNNSSSADEGGVSSWPEAVQYLLRSYATHDAIREATLRLTSIRQNSTEPEEEYSARLNNAAFRCGNVHSMDEKKTVFIDGLTTATKSLVSRFREDNPRATYLELVQHASVEGKTYRARSSIATPKKLEMAKANTPNRQATPCSSAPNRLYMPSIPTRKMTSSDEPLVLTTPTTSTFLVSLRPIRPSPFRMTQLSYSLQCPANLALKRRPIRLYT